MGEYPWLDLHRRALVASISLYPLLFLSLRGNIQVDLIDRKRIQVRLHLDSQFQSTAASREVMAVIWYPISYTVFVLPLSGERWITFHPPGKNAPAPDTLCIDCDGEHYFGPSRVASVVLTFMLTRRNLLLFMLGPGALDPHD